jgi:hypothetical protein
MNYDMKDICEVERMFNEDDVHSVHIGTNIENMLINIEKKSDLYISHSISNNRVDLESLTILMKKEQRVANLLADFYGKYDDQKEKIILLAQKYCLWEKLAELNRDDDAKTFYYNYLFFVENPYDIHAFLNYYMDKKDSDREHADEKLYEFLENGYLLELHNDVTDDFTSEELEELYTEFEKLKDTDNTRKEIHKII